MNNVFKTILEEEIKFINNEVDKNNNLIKSCNLEEIPVLEINIQIKIKENEEYLNIRDILLKKLNGNEMDDKEVAKFEEKFINIQKKLKKSLKMGKRLDNFN